MAAGDQDTRPGGGALPVNVGIGGLDGVEANIIAPCNISQGVTGADSGVLDLPHHIPFGQNEGRRQGCRGQTAHQQKRRHGQRASAW